VVLAAMSKTLALDSGCGLRTTIAFIALGRLLPGSPACSGEAGDMYGQLAHVPGVFDQNRINRLSGSDFSRTGLSLDTPFFLDFLWLTAPVIAPQWPSRPASSIGGSIPHPSSRIRMASRSDSAASLRTVSKL
jgi:hypothetical protein